MDRDCRPLAAALVALVVLGCGESPEEQRRQADVRRIGSEIYAAESCGACHGADRRGGTSGPPLRKLARHWDEEGLISFLRNPPSRTSSDARLQELSRTYSAQMAGLPGASEDKLRTLARYLLLD